MAHFGDLQDDSELFSGEPLLERCDYCEVPFDPNASDAVRYAEYCSSGCEEMDCANESESVCPACGSAKSEMHGAVESCADCGLGR